MKNFFLAFLLLLCTSVVGQNVPDNDKIFSAVSSSKSSFYYPNLMMRYRAGDNSLSDDEFAHLYYGYLFQTGYRPLENNSASDLLLSVMDASNLSEDERTRMMLQYALESFEYDPFSPTNLNLLTYIYGLMGDEKNEKINSERLQRVISTISASGTGVDENSPWHVLYFSHANDMMIFMGKQTDKRMVISRTTEFFPLKQREGDVRGYYFDYSRAYLNKPANSGDKRSAGFEFNGVKLKGNE